jgi:hypothetical protein
LLRLVCISIKLNRKNRNCFVLGPGLRDENVPLKLNAFQHSLILGSNVEPDNDSAEIIIMKRKRKHRNRFIRSIDYGSIFSYKCVA